MITLDGENLNLQQVWDVAHKGAKLSIADSSIQKMKVSRAYIEQKMEAGEVMYGVNTGFGALSETLVSKEQLKDLQINLIRSHCVGVGDPFSVPQTRAILLLRANALVRGHSGIRPEVAQKLVEFINKDIVPWVPQQGSVGASGDLAPLAHVALALMGEGKVWKNGKAISAHQFLKEKKVSPLALEFKEGLSLINGCQVMTAVGLLSLFQIRRLCLLGDLAAAASLEALRGTRSAFDPLISKTRPHSGQAKTSRNLLKFLGETSEIATSHEECKRVQDVYSLRCIPAVHGVLKDQMRMASQTLETEANSSTDNPLVFCEEKKILSCGNFHGQPLAFVLDGLSIALTSLSGISQCRIEKLVDPAV